MSHKTLPAAAPSCSIKMNAFNYRQHSPIQGVKSRRHERRRRAGPSHPAEAASRRGEGNTITSSVDGCGPTGAAGSELARAGPAGMCAEPDLAVRARARHALCQYAVAADHRAGLTIDELFSSLRAAPGTGGRPGRGSPRPAQARTAPRGSQSIRLAGGVVWERLSAARRRGGVPACHLSARR